MRIIVTGLVGLHPVGGVVYDYLQYVIGLAQLKHDVYYYEDTYQWPYNPIERRNTDNGKYSAGTIKKFFHHYAPELQNHWHYWHLRTDCFGMSRAEFDKIAQSAELFINVSGANFIPENLNSKCVKVFLDTDPGYNQIVMSERFSWSENVERWYQNVKEHDQHFTYAENINDDECIIPKLDFSWKTTRMPIVLSLWKDDIKTKSLSSRPWTTIMTWNAFKGKLIYRDNEYLSKDHEFQKFIDLPEKINLNSIIAIGGKNIPIASLQNHGWHIVDGPENTLTPEKYYNFISDSKAEFSVAKNVYVGMKTGWFSCRSACYLAMGKPVVVQDTAFSKYIPTGKGLFSFTNKEEALTCIHEVENSYKFHSNEARRIAKDYFASDVILKEMLNSL